MRKKIKRKHVFVLHLTQTAIEVFNLKKLPSGFFPKLLPYFEDNGEKYIYLSGNKILLMPCFVKYTFDLKPYMYF
jgi:hypothetical protein